MTEAEPALPTPGRAVPRLLFTVTIFFGSFLLFQVQPMVARLALPDLGGAASVWNSAMLVYQALLLAGYAWAHLLHRVPLRKQLRLHLGLLVLACFWLPVGLVSTEPPTGAAVVLFVPALLLASVGPIILAVSAQAPLMQGWFSTSGGRNPYPLYAASNLGSFTGLLAYPLLVEPLLPLGLQRWAWTVGYGLLIVLVLACGAAGSRAAVPAQEGVPAARAAPISRRQVGTWLALSAVPSALMLSTTTHLSTDIMSMPLLWAIPLGLYLLSFTVAFADRRGAARVVTRIAPAFLLVLGGTAMKTSGVSGFASAGLIVLTLFVVAVALHSRLYDSRPPAEQLTAFYLTTSVGGALGGVFCGLVAPLAFDWVYEHPVIVVAAALLVPLTAVSRRFDVARLPEPVRSRVRVGLVAGLVAASVALAFVEEPRAHLLLLLAVGAVGVLCWSWRAVYVVALVGLMLGLGARSTLPASFDNTRSRSYFGVYTVTEGADARGLIHGGTMHGAELLDEAERDLPTMYYGPSSGVGQVMSRSAELFGENASVGVVGLGAGTLACYRQPGQTWRFFEIDPVMVRIAQQDFHFLSDCTPAAEITTGDARLELGKVADDAYDVLVVDAFSSDSIPMHLMTRQAFDGYDRVVRSDGLVLVHITNRFMDLEPVLSAMVEERGWSAEVLEDPAEGALADEQLLARSVWVALSRTDGVLEDRLAGVDGDWRPLPPRDGVREWTDDYSSVLTVLKW